MANVMIDSTKDLLKGYNNNVRHFAAILGKNKDEQIAVDSRIHIERLVSEVVKYIHTFDIDSLITLWDFFNTALFVNLNEIETKTLEKLEADVFKLYLVNCVENKKKDQCTQFFDKMSPVMANNPLWTEWYSIPFVPDASSDARFSKYFSKLFQEIIFVSLHNFLSINLAKQCRPLLTSLCDTKDQGVDEGASQTSSTSHTSTSRTTQRMRDSMTEMFMDDFSIIARAAEKAKPKQTIKTMLKSFAGRRSSESAS